MMETQSVAGVACTDLHQAMSRIDGAALARLEQAIAEANTVFVFGACLLYTSPSPRDRG